MNTINADSALDLNNPAPDAAEPDNGRLAKARRQFLPWLAGSGIALGQAALATACTLPTAGKCAGCGSCVVGVASLYTWALKRRKADSNRQATSGLEPFEVITRATD
ncbi:MULTISPECIES: hypothetical protein [Methylomonas]|uniref:hypothetical protein n=1 Tax=Methylomonas TaxID=416 RepID=UPI0012326083|nr:hypothetical protein [Methylomonas rhizoryzae]